MRATPKTGSRPLVIEGQAPQFGFKKTNDVLRVCAKRVRAPIQACAHRLGAHYVGHEEWNGMNNFFNDLQGKINQAFDSSPAKDIERNVKAIMTQGFSKLDLVTREEFDIQAQVLAKTRAKLEALEVRVAQLEAKLATAETKV
jgi:BMFP domain-containing protein YqiC